MKKKKMESYRLLANSNRGLEKRKKAREYFTIETKSKSREKAPHCDIWGTEVRIGYLMGREQ